MPQGELVALCERACCALIEVAVADASLWSEIKRRITERPADSACDPGTSA
jgi:hypothetical protein